MSGKVQDSTVRLRPWSRTVVAACFAAVLIAATAHYLRIVALHPWALVALPVMPGVALLQVYASCLFYALHRRRSVKRWGEQESVDVFVATCGESTEMIEAVVVAARDMRGLHRTWLLDDAGEARVAGIAARLGVGYLSREDNEGLKAGAINAALAQTSGELVAVFDVDHRPEPEFLQRTACYFEDPAIGFVQNALSFRNEEVCWTARATAETAKEYYLLTSCGKDAVGAASMMGSNSVIRRAALEEIGGYRVGLAEDLETSLALHAAGWRSAYSWEPSAPGLTPEDYISFGQQQLKWARGVFEAGWRGLWSALPKMRWAQRLAYALRFSYYLAPSLSFLGVFVVATAILLGRPEVEGALQALMPVFLLFVLARALAFSCFVTRSAPVVTLRGTMLVMASWPVYLRALLDFLLRRPPRFLSTPKARAMAPWRTVWPQVAFCIYLSVAVVVGLLSQAPPLVALSLLTAHLLCNLSLLPSLISQLRSRVRRMLLT